MSFRGLLPLSVAALFASTFAGAAPVAEADAMSMRLEDLMEIGVVGASKYRQSQQEVAASVSVITRQEIRAHGWRTLDEALVSLPGFSTTYDRLYTYPALRGLGLPGDYATRVLVTINGNRINDPLFDQGTFGRMLPLDLDLVERIEFIPGPGGAVHGQNAMFGVVNLVTRDGAGVDGVEVSGSLQHPQDLREARLTWGGRIPGGTELLLSVSGMNAGGEDRFYEYGVSGISGNAAGLDHERDRELFARARRGPWFVDALYGQRIKGDPTASFFVDPLAAGKRNQDEYRQVQLGFEQAYFDDSLRASTRLYSGHYEAFGEATASGMPFRSEGSAQWYGADLQLVTTAIARHKLMIGAEAQIERQRDQNVLDLSNPANNLYLQGSGRRTGLYVQDEWQLTGRLSSTLGLRVDDRDDGPAVFSPRAALLWQASPAVALKVLYGRAHRAPNGFERDYSDGYARTANPRLAGERVDTAEVVVDFRASEDLALRASVYRWTLHDIVTLGIEPLSGFAQYQSGEPLRANGVELSADHTWAPGQRLRGSVSLQDAAAAGGRRLQNSPAWLGKLSLMQPLPWPGLQAAALWRYDSSRRTSAGNTLGGWGVADLTLTATGWAGGLDVTLALINLFDHRYSHPASNTNWQDALEQDGRNLRLTLGYRF